MREWRRQEERVLWIQKDKKCGVGGLGRASSFTEEGLGVSKELE